MKQKKQMHKQDFRSSDESILMEVFGKVGGEEFLVKWAKKNPGDFLALLVELITREERYGMNNEPK